MSETNRQWVLASRPKGWVSEDNFELKESDMPKPGDGQILVKVTYIAFEPAMRGWINDVESYIKPVQIGEPMRAMGAGEVVESNHPDFKPGDQVSGFFGWQEYAVVDAEGALFPVQKLEGGVDPELALSILGITGLTGYFGFLEHGQPKEGDVVVVSGAAGATGSVVGQIAKIKGCTVIGIAGGPEKCKWLIEELGFDHAIDYKSEKISRRLRELAPKGINIFYDNVGGEALEAVLNNLHRGARLVICGGISGYNEPNSLPPGPKNYLNIVMWSSTMRGFLLGDFSDRFDEGTKQLTEWVKEGKIKAAVDVQTGFDKVPATFMRLFEGKNIGKQLLKL